MSASPIVSAAERIAVVGRELEDGALRLAYHAAVPVVVDAELLNLLRVNFFLDPPVALRYESEAQLLLSPLFTEIGDGLFEIEPEVRNLLISGLYSGYGPDRVRRVALLLEQYTDATPAWRSQPELEYAQRLTAVSFLDPARATQWLEENSSGPSTEDLGREWYVAMRRRVAEQSLVMTFDDRIDDASGNLRNDDIEVRLQAIRDLDALSRLPEANRRQIVSVLSEFIEVRSPLTHVKGVLRDVQAALTLAGTLPGHGFKLDRATLRRANLVGLDFSGARFSDVMLSDVDATGINLSNAIFVRVSIVGSVLDGARLDGAKLQFEDLINVSLVTVSTAGLRISADRAIGVDMRDMNGSTHEISASIVASVSYATESNIADSHGDGDGTPPPRDSSEARGRAGAEIHALLGLARGLKNQRELRGAADAYDGAILLSMEHENRALEATALLEISEVNLELGSFDTAMLNIHNALMIFRQLGDRQGEGRAEVALAKVMAMTGVPDGAEDHYLRALDLFAELGDIESRADVLANLADVMIELGRYSEAAAFAERGARNFREIGHSAAAISLLKRLAETIEAAGHHDISLSLFEKALMDSVDLLGNDHPDTLAIADMVGRRSPASEVAGEFFHDWSVAAVGRVLGPSGTKSGTCFRVARRVWVTTRTVLSAVGSASPGSAVRLSPALGGGFLNASVERVDHKDDLAVLIADGDPYDSVSYSTGMPVLLSEFCAADQIRPGDAVGVISPRQSESDSFAFAEGEWVGQASDGSISVAVAGHDFAGADIAGAPIMRVRDGAVAGVALEARSLLQRAASTVQGVRAEDVVALLDGIADVTMDTSGGQPAG